MKIYQAYMDAHQRTFVRDGAVPFDASANCAPGTREYELFKQLHADTTGRGPDEPWGLVSWKFEHKAPVSFPFFRDFCRAALEDGADCVFLNPMIGNEAVYANGWEQGIHCGHLGIEKIAYFLNERTGLRITAPSDTGTFAFCNYFVARPHFWEGYIAFVDRALALLDAEAIAGSEVGQIYNGSGHYERDTGATMRVFVIERLFSSYLLQQDTCRVVGYTPAADDYDRKFGVRLGELLWNLSRVKRRALETGDAAIYRQWDRQRNALLSGWHINIIWNLDDPMVLPLTTDYLEFRNYCEHLFAGDAPRNERLQGAAR